MDIEASSLKLTFAQAGEGSTRDDGFIHRKTVPYMIVAQAVEGSYDISCAGGPLARLKTGEAFLSVPGVPLAITHNCDPSTGRMHMRWAHFNFSVFDAVPLSSLIELPPGMEEPWSERIGRLSAKMLAIQRSDQAQSLASASRVSSLAFEILSELLDFLEAKGLKPGFDPGILRLLPALEYARRNLSSKIEVGDMARRAGLSVPRFHAEFKSRFGETPLEHLKKARLSKACGLLRGTALSLEQIADETGFCSQFHFSREFRRAYGEPPSTYRRSMRDGLAL